MFASCRPLPSRRAGGRRLMFHRLDIAADVQQRGMPVTTAVFRSSSVLLAANLLALHASRGFEVCS